MRIDDNRFDKKSQIGTSGVSTADSVAGQSRSGRGNSSAQRDSVVVSDLGNLLTQLSSLGESPRTEFVSRIAQQYRSGSYVVDNAALGNALMDRAFEG